MAGNAVDIKMLGDKGLERMLRELPDKAQKKVVRQAMRATVKTLHKELIRRAPVLLGNVTDLKGAFAQQKVTPGKRSRDSITLGIPMPTREEVGIEGDYYHPMHVEFGHGDVRAHPYIRPAVDENAEREKKAMGNKLKIGIPKEAARLARK